jgi:hypothetical protein
VIAKRLPDGTDANTLVPGDYCRGTNGGLGVWVFPPKSERYPEPSLGFVSERIHVILDKDGVITISPSILQNRGDKDGPVWHGFLVAGVWSEA